jgi:methylenetetrahydrofolate dehydrogenase (NADP+)/methenyltetrahydrofolate cyclohydrolase
MIKRGMAQMLIGTEIAAGLRGQISQAVANLVARGTTPGLATVLVGEHPASLSYIRSKQRGCEETGMRPIDVRLPGTTTEDELLAEIRTLNERADVHGILVQQPLPKQIDAETVVAAIDPAKDVDGFHPVNLGRLLRGLPSLVPCTPLGVVKMLEYADVQLPGANVVIVGRSLLVGKPLAALLMRKDDHANATVTVCHSRTRDIAAITSRADIVVAAIGVPEFLTADMVAEDSVVIDVGINRVEDATRKRGYRLTGDVDFASVSSKARLITPVPRGVGPMTVTMLLYNTVQAARGRTSFEELA